MPGKRRRGRAGRIAIAVAATIAAGGAAAGGAQADAPWLPGADYGAGTLSTRPELAVSPDGPLTVAWSQQLDIDDASAFVQRASAFGAPGPAAQLSPNDDVVINADAAPAGEGRAVVALYTADDGDLSEGKLATVGPGGAVTSLRTFASDVDAYDDNIPLTVAANDSGDAVVGWTSEDPDGAIAWLSVRRAAANGVLGPEVPLDSVGLGARVEIAMTPDGRARLAWIDDSSHAMVARLRPDGTLDGPPQQVSPDAKSITVAAGPGGALATWLEWRNDSYDVRFARMPSTGALVEGQGTAAQGLDPVPAEIAAGVADDGAATLAWSTRAPSGRPVVQARATRADGSLGPLLQLSEAAGDDQLADVGPVLVPTRDGTRAVWVRVSPAGATEIASRAIGADGSLGPVSVVGRGILGKLAEAPFAAGADASGNVTVGWLTGSPGDETFSFSTATLDVTPPAVTAEATPSVAVGQEASFSASATDRAGVASYRWQFGDDSASDRASATHVYGRAGTYEASVTVTDVAGNATVVRRTVTVTAPPGGGPGPGPGGPGGDDPRPRASRAAAGLRLVRATRRGARVAVAGTIARRASGRVTIVWRQRLGRRTVRRTVRATIRKGRFSATIAIPASAARVRTTGTVTVSYAGDADTRAATASRRVASPRAKPRRR